MSACAAAVSATTVTLVCALVVAISHVVDGAEVFDCYRDGLHTDYDRDCREYVRCSDGAVTGRYSCPTERVFSEAVGACVPRGYRPCARRLCAATDTFAYSTPGTSCRHYYRCENGTTMEAACPPRTWFDIERQACTRGAGTCFEPVCAGLPDGDYPDSSHDCRRVLQCRGGKLRNLKSHGDVYTSLCQPARIAAVPMPVGDADFCSDESCSSLCIDANDGAYADRTAGCREYFVCESRRVIRRGVCEPGRLFYKGACEPATRSVCPAPALSQCWNRHDGIHRDWRDCASWFECRREKVISRGSCPSGLIFDGSGCESASKFLCDGPVIATECKGLPSGMYQDLSSNCTRYFHCDGPRRTTLACPSGEVYDGDQCTPESNYLCPSRDRESCFGRSDGRYRAAATGCRGYYECARAVKSIYACSTDEVFDGEKCVPAESGLCEREDYSCEGLADGYHPEIESGCRRYFYCEHGDRLATLTCQGEKIFDGRICMKKSQHECGSTPRDSVENDGKKCEQDGFFVQQGTECKRYYFCVTGTRTYLTCPTDQVFNGQVCVSNTQYTCPG